MKFLKSNPNWVNQDILKMILDGTGEQRPLIDEQDEPWKKDQWDRWRNSGWDMKGVSWHMFYYHHLGMSSMNELELPIDVEGSIIEWWFCKINPCCVFPMHVDAFKTEAKNFALECAKSSGKKRLRDRDHQQVSNSEVNTIVEKLRKKSEHAPAVTAAVESIILSQSLPFDEGLSQERATFQKM